MQENSTGWRLDTPGRWLCPGPTRQGLNATAARILPVFLRSVRKSSPVRPGSQSKLKSGATIKNNQIFQFLTIFEKAAEVYISSDEIEVTAHRKATPIFCTYRAATIKRKRRNISAMKSPATSFALLGPEPAG